MIQSSFIISLSVLFIHATTWDGQIMSWVRKIIDEKSMISKPVYNCPICMTPWWGTAMYLVFWKWSFSFSSLREWALIILCASGISVLNVIAIHIKDYCIARTPDKDKCC